jgi:hypothetical protein
MVLSTLKPGVLENILIGEIEGMQITPELLFFYAVIVVFPLTMAFLTQILKDNINRWANVIMGTVGVILSLFGLSQGLDYAYSILLWMVKIIVNILIIYHAYKWPKEA